jgi:hypothetical protein
MMLAIYLFVHIHSAVNYTPLSQHGEATRKDGCVVAHSENYLSSEEQPLQSEPTNANSYVPKMLILKSLLNEAG